MWLCPRFERAQIRAVTRLWCSRGYRTLGSMPTPAPVDSQTPKARKRSDAKGRRSPKQERSQHTVDAILTAAKTLVVKHGLDRVTTNGVARLAGVSIGSLYQYFPSKRAIITELRKQHQQAGERIFRAEAANLVNAPVRVAVRRFVEKMIEVHREEPELHRALELEGRSVWVGDWERQAIGIVRLYLEHHRDELTVHDLDQAAHLLMITAEAITHGLVLERPDLLRDATVVDGVVRMFTAYLTSTVPSEAPLGAVRAAVTSADRPSPPSA
jgi:AcrR family transcriptional regulator